MQFDEEMGSQTPLLIRNKTTNTHSVSSWVNHILQSLTAWFSRSNASNTVVSIEQTEQSNQQRHPILQHDPIWTRGLENKTLFYQGMLTSQLQIVQYIGMEIIRLTTGQNVRSNKPRITLFQAKNVWLYPEIPEINREISFWQYRYQHILQYVLGLQVAELTDGKPTYETIFPDVENGSVVGNFGITSSPNSLGQETDITCHKKKYDALMVCLNPEYVIAFSPSRGGATAFAALATRAEGYNNIKLCILEGPPGSISAQFKFYFQHYFPLLSGKSFYNSFIAYYCLGHEHKTGKEHQAIYHAKHFPLHIPLVIISSKNDEVVCHKSSLNLACLVAGKRIEVAAEHPEIKTAEVYFIQLDTAKHNYYTDRAYYPKDSARYQNWVHRIYKKLGLPYIESYASAAEMEHELHAIELTQGPLQTIVQLQTLFKENKQARRVIRETAQVQLQNTLNSILDLEAKQRVASISAAMPLFSKPLQNRCSFFAAKESTQETDLFISCPQY